MVPQPQDQPGSSPGLGRQLVFKAKQGTHRSQDVAECHRVLRLQASTQTYRSIVEGQPSGNCPIACNRGLAQILESVGHWLRHSYAVLIELMLSDRCRCVCKVIVFWVDNGEQDSLSRVVMFCRLHAPIPLFLVVRRLIAADAFLPLR